MLTNFFTYETKRILKSKFTQITLLLVCLFPLLVGIFSPYLNQDTINSVFGIASATLLSQTILVPAKIGAVFSTLLFTALTIFEFDKLLRFRVNDIIEPIASITKIHLSKVIGLLCSGLIATIAPILIMLPYYVLKMGNLHHFSYFVLSYFLIVGGAIALTILMSAGFYLMFRNANVTCIIMLLAVLFSFVAGIINYQYTWVLTGATGFSENFGSGNLILGMLWNRLFGLMVATSIFLFGLLCDRCYEKGLLNSLFHNTLKYKWLSTCFLLSFLSAFLVFQREPIFKALSLTDLTSMFIYGKKETPTNSNLLATSDTVINLKIVNDKKYAVGTYIQELQNNTDEPQALYFELADGYQIKELTLDGKDLSYILISPQTMGSAKLKDIYELSIPNNTTAKLCITYIGTPKTLSVVHDFSIGISNEYVNLKGTMVAPLVCLDQKNTMIRGTIEVDSRLTVITQGDKNEKLSANDEFTTWSFAYDNLSDFYLTAALYGVFERNECGTNVEFFYPLAASKEFESRGNDILDIFSFFSKSFGPLRKDSLKVVVTSGINGGGGVQAGNISYVTEDCLTKKGSTGSSLASSSDGFATLTHEIAHQWWGGGIHVTNKKSDNKTDQTHKEWSSEAFADFSTYLFLKEKYSTAYADSLLLKKWEEGVSELNRNFYQRNPAYMNKLSGIPNYYVSLLLKGNQIYALGPLTIYQVYQEIGEDEYRKAMKVIYDTFYDQSDNKLSYSKFYTITGATGR